MLQNVILECRKDGANRGDIGFASRAFKEEDGDISKAMKSGQYCIDAVVAVVNKENNGCQFDTGTAKSNLYW